MSGESQRSDRLPCGNLPHDTRGALPRCLSDVPAPFSFCSERKPELFHIDDAEDFSRPEAAGLIENHDTPVREKLRKRHARERSIRRQTYDTTGLAIQHQRILIEILFGLEELAFGIGIDARRREGNRLSIIAERQLARRESEIEDVRAAAVIGDVDDTVGPATHIEDA